MENLFLCVAVGFLVCYSFRNRDPVLLITLCVRSYDGKVVPYRTELGGDLCLSALTFQKVDCQ